MERRRDVVLHVPVARHERRRQRLHELCQQRKMKVVLWPAIMYSVQAMEVSPVAGGSQGQRVFLERATSLTVADTAAANAATQALSSMSARATGSESATRILKGWGRCVYRRRPNAFSDLEVSSLVMVIIWWPKMSGGAGAGWSTKGWPSWYFDIYNRGEGAQRKTLHGVGNSPERSMFQHGQGRNEGRLRMNSGHGGNFIDSFYHRRGREVWLSLRHYLHIFSFKGDSLECSVALSRWYSSLRSRPRATTQSCHAKAREYLQLTVTDSTTYGDITEAILSYDAACKVLKSLTQGAERRWTYTETWKLTESTWTKERQGERKVQRKRKGGEWASAWGYLRGKGRGRGLKGKGKDRGKPKGKRGKSKRKNKGKGKLGQNQCSDHLAIWSWGKRLS